MKTQRSIFGFGAVIVLFPLLVAVLLLGVVAPSHGSRHEERLPEYVRLLQSEDARVRNQAVDGILQDRNRTIEQLIPLIDPANAAKYGGEGRAAAAYLLGEFRAVEAVPVLSKALADERGLTLIDDTSRFDAAVWTALVKIGRPAVPAMIENIETSDNRILRIKSMDVLNHVLGGKRRVLELMAKLKARAAGDEQKVRRIRDAAEWARGHWKGDKELLY